MKKPIIVLIVLIIIGLVIWKFSGNSAVSPQTGGQAITPSGITTPSVPTSEKAKVSDKLSSYQNDELGFSVKYPTSWIVEESPSSIVFNASIDSSGKNTVNRIESKIDAVPGKCAFPPVTTIKERTTTKVGALSFNMISMSNSVQGRNYFNRMYTLQNGAGCFVLTFSSVTLSASGKVSSGEVQQVNANNKALVDTADGQFKDLVKSFAYVIGPKGEDEVKMSPKK